jgi:ABC-type transport system involved in multi-copper enzyme maturation permease subunit
MSEKQTASILGSTYQSSKKASSLMLLGFSEMSVNFYNTKLPKISGDNAPN